METFSAERIRSAYLGLGAPNAASEYLRKKGSPCLNACRQFSYFCTNEGPSIRKIYIPALVISFLAYGRE